MRSDTMMAEKVWPGPDAPVQGTDKACARSLIPRKSGCITPMMVNGNPLSPIARPTMAESAA